MEHLPAELLVQIIPDPDTLGRMLRLCKQVLAALTSTGQFKLEDKDDLLRVYNDAIMFSVRPRKPHIEITRQTARNTVTDMFTSSELYERLRAPRYLRVCGNLILTIGGVGWDTVRYKNKLAIKTVRIFATDRCTYKVSRVVPSGKILASVHAGEVKYMFLHDESCEVPTMCLDVTGPHVIYERV